uniref:Uncharacterized protein n=1 Tax=Arundo donax TaxID=35708 RepID=A0A0A9A5F0_ARUDO
MNANFGPVWLVLFFSTEVALKRLQLIR